MTAIVVQEKRNEMLRNRRVFAGRTAFADFWNWDNNLFCLTRFMPERFLIHRLIIYAIVNSFHSNYNFHYVT